MWFGPLPHISVGLKPKGLFSLAWPLTELKVEAGTLRLKWSGRITVAALEKEKDTLPFIDSFHDLACDLGLIRGWQKNFCYI